MSERAQRVVLLGASNVRMGLATLMNSARALAGGPVELLAASGHGRSYGKSSSVPGRTLPGVLQCPLWEDLARRPAASPVALVTDIGNDLLYRVSPPQVVSWVAECVDRLLDAGARVAITELPIASMERLGSTRYRLMRTLIFPACRLSLEEIHEQAYELNTGIKSFANERGIAVETLPGDWYGFDPIHIKRSKKKFAWKKLLRSAFGTDEQATTAPLSLLQRCSLKFALPAERRVLGFDQRCSQPCRVYRDGSRLSLY